MSGRAIAVHPDDERYKDIVGKMCKLPLTDREIPIVADYYVDKEFGTGAVKITPAHDPNDFEVGKRHNLPEINIMNDDATINEQYGGKYAGMDRYEARKAMVADLEEQGYLVKVVPHSHNVGTHDRCHTTVEPMIKQQWFVKMEELAKPAIEAIKNGDLRFVPERFNKIYLHWLENIRDWCISRQIWWGHRIPAYYCDECGEVVVGHGAPEKCPKCGCTHFTLTNLETFADSVRKHWAIENQLHWCLDVVFREDASRARKDNSPLNLNVLRKTALNLVSQAQYKRISKKRLMFRAALEPTLFLDILFDPSSVSPQK